MASSMWRACAGAFLCLVSLRVAEAAVGDWDRSYGTAGQLSLTAWLTEPGATFHPSTWQPQADGKIVIAGWVDSDSTGDAYRIVRLNANGTLDSSFDGDGVAILELSNGARGGMDLALLPDGRILVAAQGPFAHPIIVVRLNANGSYDNAFGTGGQQTISQTYQLESPQLALAPDGSAIVATRLISPPTALVAKITPAGAFDPSFGTNGIATATSPIGAVSSVSAVAVNADGVIAIGGTYSTSSFVARLSSAGQQDREFSSNFGANFPFGVRYISDVAVTADGKVIAATGIGVGSWGPHGFARFNANGEADSSFGSGGRVIVTGELHAMLLEPSGKVVVAGSNWETAPNLGWLARYNTDGSPDVTFGLRGASLTDFSQGAELSRGPLEQVRRDVDGGYRAMTKVHSGYDTAYTLARFAGDSGASAGVIGLHSTLANPLGRLIEDAVDVSVLIYRSGGAGGSVSVQYRVVGQSATADQDFLAATGTVTFNTGETSKTISVRILEDALVESDESFYVELFAPSGGAALSRSRADFLLVNDDWQPAVSVADVTVNEAAGTATVTATLSSAPTETLQLWWQTKHGTTTRNDVSPVDGALTWAAGDATPRQIVIPIQNDSLDEVDEMFTVEVARSEAFWLDLTATARVTLVDDDPTPAGQSGPATPGFRFSARPPVTEGTDRAQIGLIRVGDFEGEVMANCSAAESSASMPDDYFPSWRGVMWIQLEQQAPLTMFYLNGDMQAEPDETVTVRCAPSIGSIQLAPLEVTFTIVDDDTPTGPPARVEFISAAQSVNESATSVTLQVARSGNPNIASSVDYETVADTASAGDFTAASGTLTWGANDTSTRLITIALAPDSADESDESFAVSLRNASAGTELGTASATVTIVDDDAASGGSGSTGGGGGGGGGEESLIALLLWAGLLSLRRRATRC